MKLSSLGTIMAGLVLSFLVWRFAQRAGVDLDGLSTVDVMFGIVLGVILLLTLGGGPGGNDGTPAPTPPLHLSRTWR